MAVRPEGIRTSQRPPGRLASRWLAMLDALDERIKGRVMRGRTLARAGRVSQLEVAPGAALAEVHDAGPQRVTVRVRTFDEAEWAKVLGVLRAKLSVLALLFEGEVADELLAALDAQGILLVPGASEIDGDCDCGDWAVPCTHGGALHHVLGEALDGEPFLLFTLRGRTREQLLTELRRGWGDAASRAARASPEPAERDGDPFASPTRPPMMTFRFSSNPGPPGMVALGPLPGDEDLMRALAPLYQAGSAAAIAMALAEGSPDAPRRRRRSMIPTASPKHDAGARAAPGEPTEDLTERIVDLLADADDGLPSDELARLLGVSPVRAKNELEELAKIGLVFRSGTGAGRWALG